MFRESTSAENCTTTMLVSCAMQAEPRDCRSVLENGHHHRMLLLSVTLHWHNIGDPEIQGHQIPPVFGDLRGEQREEPAPKSNLSASQTPSLQLRS
jgi:hypothetical protein